MFDFLKLLDVSQSIEKMQKSAYDKDLVFFCD